MKAAIRMPKFLSSRRGDEGLDPDTAIVDDGEDLEVVRVRAPGATRKSAASAPAPDAMAVDEGMLAERDDTTAAVRFGMAPETRVRLWISALVISLVGATGVFVLHTQRGAELNRLSKIATETLSSSYLLTRAVDAAFNGSSDGFRRVGELRDSIGRQLESLGAAKVSATGSSMVETAVRRVGQGWIGTSAAIGSIFGQRRLLETIGAVRESALTQGPRMYRSAMAIMDARVAAGAPGQDVAVAGRIAALSQRVAKEAATIHAAHRAGTASSNDIATGVAELTALVGAVPASERTRVADASVQDARTALRTSVLDFSSRLSALAGSEAAIESVMKAEASVDGSARTLGKDLEALQSALQLADDDRRTLIYIAAALAIVAAISAFGLSRSYVRVSSLRADDAERQRLVAEDLEQAAQRMNDLNQAAILRLMNELQEVADGDLTVQATVSEDITGAIADSVNYTVEELRSLVARINSTAELVNEASSTAQMTATSLQAASEQQSREIKETGESVLRMAQQINEVSARAAESVKVARQSVSASQEGSRAVDNAISGMNGIRDQIQETAKRIKRLGESSQEVGEIVELISDITEQTNVLALNAAIQAASAGEAGRGFTIVAEEVQRLAERSGEATKQISALIKTIQTDTQDAVAAMERSTQGVVEGTRLSDEAGSALQVIGQVSQQLAELIEGFSATTSKQAASAGTVAQSIQRILLVTEQTSEGTLQTAGSIRQLSELAQELKNSVSRFKVA